MKPRTRAPNTRTLLPAIVRSCPLHSSLLILLTLGSGLLPVGIAVLLGRLVGSLAAGDVHEARAEAVAVVIAFTCLQVAAPMRLLFTDAVGRRFLRHVVDRAMRSTTAADLSAVERPEIQDLVGRATSAGSFGPRAAVQGLVSRWNVRIASVAGLLLLAKFSPAISALLFLTLINEARAQRTRSRSASVIFRKRTDALRRADYLRELILGPRAGKEVRLFGLQQWLTNRYGRSFDDAMDPVWQERRKLDVRLIALGLGPLTAALGVVGWYLLSGIDGGRLAADEVVVILQAVLIALAFGSQFDQDVYVEQGGEVARASLELETTLRAGRPAHRDRVPTPPATDGHAAVSLRDLEFRFPANPQPTLVGVSLEIPPGGVLAVVGANGAGKTTLMKVIAGLYRPTAGSVLVDGIPLSEEAGAAWRAQVAAVFQDFVRYPLTLAENITFGPPEDADLLADVIRMTGLDQVVSRLPSGVQTMLGREFHDGTDLSGGEWQRVAIARAIYAARRGRRLVIFDEPTAHLDIEAEAMFIDVFLTSSSGLTRILVTHRLSMVAGADRIAVLDSGRIVEVGTHEELIALGGLYAEMFATQAAQYVER